MWDKFLEWLKDYFDPEREPKHPNDRDEPNVPDEVPVEIPATGKGKPLMYYPDAVLKGTGMHRNRFYKHKYPTGAVVHYSAGRNNVENLRKYLIKQGYGCIIIARDGKVYQDSSLDQWQPHAGSSQWNHTTGTSVNNQYVGIEMMSAGKLEVKNGKYFAWFGTEIDAKEVRTSSKVDNIKAGSYQVFTEAQEKSLVKLLLWLAENGNGVFRIENICGHDECKPVGKSDPGACLSMSMPKLRHELKRLSALSDSSITF